MNTERSIEIISSEIFWVGVLASILAAIILSISAYIFRNAIKTAKERSYQGRIENEIFEKSLGESSPYAPFAFGVAQGRALKYFFISVFISYAGDITSLFWPINIVLYCISMYFLWKGLRWIYKIEIRAMDIMKRDRAS